MRKTERLQIGIGRYIEVTQTLPALRLTPKRQHIRGVRHSCGGRYKVERVMTCRLCFYRGKSRVLAKCVACGQGVEMWLLPDGRLAF